MTALVSTALLRTQSDARLVALTRDGHDRAFEAIVERYRRPLHAHCRRILPHARAEDVVQQTFLSAWSALREGEEVRDLRAWLYRIAHNTALNALKRSGYDYDELRESLRPAPGPDEDLERRQIIRETLAGVAALPARQREALLRTAVQGVSGEAVARELGITDGALRQLIHRARNALRAAATAVVPLPLVARVAAMAADGAPGSERVGELVAGAGSAGIAGGLIKAGSAVVVAGALATGAATGVREATHHRPATPRVPVAEAAASDDAPDAAAAERVAASPDRLVAAPGNRGRRGSGDTHGRRGRSHDRRGRGRAGDDIAFAPIGRRGPSSGPGPSGGGRHEGEDGSGDHHSTDGHSGPGGGGGEDRSGSGGGSGSDDGIGPVAGTDTSGPGSGSGADGESLDGGSGERAPSMSDSTSGSGSGSGDDGSGSSGDGHDGDSMSGSSGSGGS